MTQQNPNPNNNANPTPPPEPVQQTGGVQTPPNDDTMHDGDAGNASAAVSPAEDTYAKLFEQSQSQVAQLIEQNKSLQSQVETLLRNGAVIHDDNAVQTQQANIGNMTQEQMDYKHSGEYVSLADLGKDIGKREYININDERKGEGI